MSDRQYTINVDMYDSAHAAVTVTGRVYALNASELQYALTDAIDRGRINITVDMSGVDFLSSAGIRAILGAYKKAKAKGGGLRVKNPSENVRNVLGATALDELMIL